MVHAATYRGRGWPRRGLERSQLTLAAAAPAGDPPGANGTVKIDGLAFDSGIDNEPP
jgi:hypothetical protein